MPFDFGPSLQPTAQYSADFPAQRQICPGISLFLPVLFPCSFPGSGPCIVSNNLELLINDVLFVGIGFVALIPIGYTLGRGLARVRNTG